jgi:hypothetical protein
MTKTQAERDADTIRIGQIVVGAVVLAGLALLVATLLLHHVPGFARH